MVPKICALFVLFVPRGPTISTSILSLYRKQVKVADQIYKSTYLR